MTREEEVIDIVNCSFWHTRLRPSEKDMEQTIRILEQRLRTGHWILVDVEEGKVWHCKCSKCGKDPLDYVWGSENWWLIKSRLPKFCPNCGARMEAEE